MIRPIKTSKILWILEWIDFDEPAFLGGRCMLPSAIYIFRSGSTPPLGQELLPELDQRRAERLLSRLMADNGHPDKLYIAGADEWDEEEWEVFARESGFSISFYEENETGVPRAVIEAREARDKAAETLRARLASELAHAPPERSVAIASDLAEAASSIRSPRKRRAMFEQAIALDKSCPPAIGGLAEIELHLGAPDAALRLFNRLLSQSALSVLKGSGDLWEDTSARVFLRGLYGRAMAHWHKGNLSEALSDLERLLEANPVDHQGARFFIPLLMQLNDLHAEAARWFAEYEERYPGDFHDPGLFFSWGLSLSLEEREEEAFHRYRDGMLRNLYIAPQLLDVPEPPDDIWQPNDRCEPGYADDFVRSFSTLWEREAAARRFLGECHRRLQPDIEAMIDLRRRMGTMQDQRYDPNHEKNWASLVEEEKRLLNAAKPSSETNA